MTNSSGEDVEDLGIQQHNAGEEVSTQGWKEPQLSFFFVVV